jgi:YD repeat-containing protein
MAQTPIKAKVSGTTTDASGKPMEFVTLMLMKAADSTLVKGVVSANTGAYEFESVAEGRYIVVATQLGYQKQGSAPFSVDAMHTQVTVPALTLNEETKLLKEVVISAQKPFIEQQIDRTVVNVENSIVSSGNTALEVLEKAPGVTIDRQNDQIQLRGKTGIIVMIDGKQTYLSSQEVSNLLKNMPSDNIEKIEIITNPSSKYDAAGNSGIINIRMKKNKNFGTNGTAIVGAGYGRYEKANGSLQLNHRVGNINAFGNYSYSYRKSFQENDINRIITTKDENGNITSTTYFDQSSVRQNWLKGHNYRAGVDYFIDKKSTIGILATGFINDWNQPNAVNNTIIRDDNREITMKPTTDVTVQNKQSNLTGNINYKYDFNGQGHELTADADYSRFDGSSYNRLLTIYRDANEEIAQPSEEFRNFMPSVIDIWAFKADYTLPLKNGNKFEAGVKSSLVYSDNNLRYENNAENGWIRNDTNSNHFKYQENINAAYANYATKLDTRTKLQLGLRVEQTHSEGHSLTLNRKVPRKYINLFPTFFISRQLDTNNVLNLSYSRRVDRPNYQDLNPAVFYLDPYTFQQGNPYLQPQFTHTLQLTHTYKGAFSTTLGYSYTTDAIVREAPRQRVDVDGKKQTYVMADNLATQQNVNLTLSCPIPVRNWWNIQNNLTIVYDRYNSPYLDAQFNLEVISWNAYMSNNFILSEGLTAELAGWYNSAGLYGFYKSQPMGGFSVGVQKKLMNKRANLKLNINDPFWLNKFSGKAEYQDINFRVKSRWESRVARITFTYNFGNQNVKAARQRSTGTEAERNRAGGGNN